MKHIRFTHPSVQSILFGMIVLASGSIGSCSFPPLGTPTTRTPTPINPSISQGTATPTAPLPSSGTATAQNRSVLDPCAEHDNVTVPLFSSSSAYAIEATHPQYAYQQDNTATDFTNCPPFNETTYSFTPKTVKIYDDGITVMEAVTDPQSWQPQAMTVQADNGPAISEVHYLRVYRLIPNTNSYPQIMVQYHDGNVRLKPQPPEGRTDTAFGSSVIVGTAKPSDRPIAAIQSISYQSANGVFTVVYRNNEQAELRLDNTDRTMTRLSVRAQRSDNQNPFVTLRSMYVAEDNCDVGRLHYGGNDAGIMEFITGTSNDWFFYRSTPSKHNTSAPDIRILVN